MAREGKKLLNLHHAGSSISDSLVNMTMKYGHLSACHLEASSERVNEVHLCRSCKAHYFKFDRLPSAAGTGHIM